MTLTAKHFAYLYDREPPRLFFDEGVLEVTSNEVVSPIRRNGGSSGRGVGEHAYGYGLTSSGAWIPIKKHKK